MRTVSRAPPLNNAVESVEEASASTEVSITNYTLSERQQHGVWSVLRNYSRRALLRRCPDKASRALAGAMISEYA